MPATSEIKIAVNAVDNASGILKNINKTALAVGAALTAIGIAGIKAMSNLVENASDLQESANAVNVVFKESSDIIHQFGLNSAKAVGLSTSAFNELTSVTGTLLSNTGMNMDEVANATLDLTTRAADLASVYNTDVSDALNAINAAVRGETEAIRRYGADVTDASLSEYLLAQGINKTATELTYSEKQYYRYLMILEQTTVAAGDFANTSDGLANRQRILQSSVTNLKAELGNALLPAFESIVGIVQKVVDWFKGLTDGQKKFIVIAAAVAAVLAVVIGPLLILISILPALAAGFGMLSASILPVTAAIVALVAIGALLYKNWDKIKSSKLFDTIKSTFKPIIESLKTAFNNIKDAVKIFWDALKQLWDLIKGPVLDVIKVLLTIMGGALIIAIKAAVVAIKVISAIVKVLAEIFSGLVNVVVGVAGAIKSVWEGLVNFFKGVWSSIKSLGAAIGNVFIGMANAVINAWNGIVNGIASAINAVIRGINTVIRLLNKVPGVNFRTVGSVSLSFAKIGNIPYLAEGGIVTSPTMAMIGERGPEAVVPLDKSYGTTVNNYYTFENINGLSGRDIARQLQKELNKQI